MENRTMFYYVTQDDQGVTKRSIFTIRNGLKQPQRSREWKTLKRWLNESPFKGLKVQTIGWDKFHGDDYPLPF